MREWKQRELRWLTFTILNSILNPVTVIYQNFRWKRMTPSMNVLKLCDLKYAVTGMFKIVLTTFVFPRPVQIRSLPTNYYISRVITGQEVTGNELLCNLRWSTNAGACIQTFFFHFSSFCILSFLSCLLQYYIIMVIYTVWLTNVYNIFLIHFIL